MSRERISRREFLAFAAVQLFNPAARSLSVLVPTGPEYETYLPVIGSRTETYHEWEDWRRETAEHIGAWRAGLGLHTSVIDINGLKPLPDYHRAPFVNTIGGSYYLTLQAWNNIKQQYPPKVINAILLNSVGGLVLAIDDQLGPDGSYTRVTEPSRTPNFTSDVYIGYGSSIGDNLETVPNEHAHEMIKPTVFDGKYPGYSKAFLEAISNLWMINFIRHAREYGIDFSTGKLHEITRRFRTNWYLPYDEKGQNNKDNWGYKGMVRCQVA